MRESWHSLREYQTLRSVLESGTTISAARRLGLSQSAISRSLSSLEARLGHALFSRESGRLVPTVEAVKLNAKLDHLFQALEEINQTSLSSKETLRIIAPPTYAHSLLVSHIANFLTINQNFFVSLEVGTTEDVVKGVLENQFDLGFTGVEQNRSGLKLTPFRRSSAVCVMPLNHDLAKLDVVTPADLDNQRLIALTSRHQRRSQLEKLILDAGGRAEIIAEVGTTVSAIELARHDLGVAVVNPFPVLDAKNENLVVKTFVSPISYQSYFAANDKQPSSRVARAFMGHIRTFSRNSQFSTKV
ncbi:MAG: LysR family transcriptional regulator [Lentilitoribacter sp.]